MIDKEEQNIALAALEDMISRSRTAEKKLRPGSSSHTLIGNRIHALEVAYALEQGTADGYDISDFKKAYAPLVSLESKSGKVFAKIPESGWQHKMLGANLDALRSAVGKLTQKLGEYTTTE